MSQWNRDMGIGFFEDALYLKTKWDAPTHVPQQAPLSAYERTLSMRPSRGASQALPFVYKISGFVVNSSRSYAK